MGWVWEGRKRITHSRLWGANKQPAENWQGGRHTNTVHTHAWVHAQRVNTSTNTPRRGEWAAGTHGSRTRATLHVLPTHTKNTPTRQGASPRLPPVPCAASSVNRPLYHVASHHIRTGGSSSVHVHHASPAGRIRHLQPGAAASRGVNTIGAPTQSNTSFCSNRGWQFTRTGVILVLWDKEE